MKTYPSENTLFIVIGFCPLASGSRGNCIYLGTRETRILIDAGLTAGATLKKLEQIGVGIETIQAVLVTHEHTDHIRGIARLYEKWNIPVFTNAETAKGIVDVLGLQPRFRLFTTGESFFFGDLEILPFCVPHDTLDPVAFIVKAMGRKIGFCTDFGHVTSLVRKMLEGCDYLYLESNHQPSMVHASPRPLFYKRRVLSREGHLSNEECATLLASIAHKGLRHVHLAHLSSECNAEELALKIARDALSSWDTCVSVAYQDSVSTPIPFP